MDERVWSDPFVVDLLRLKDTQGYVYGSKYTPVLIRFYYNINKDIG